MCEKENYYIDGEQTFSYYSHHSKIRTMLINTKLNLFGKVTKHKNNPAKSICRSSVPRITFAKLRLKILLFANTIKR